MVRSFVFLLLLVIGGLGIFFSHLFLSEKTKENTPLIFAVPNDASIVVEIRNPLSVWSNLSETNLIWEELKQIPQIEKLSSSIAYSDSIARQYGLFTSGNQTMIVSIHPHTDGVAIFLAVPASEKQFKTIKNTMNNGWNIAYHSPFMLVSNTPHLLTKSIKQLSSQTKKLVDDNSFKTVFKTNSKYSTGSLYINIPNLKRLMIPFFTKKEIENFNSNETWGSYDIIINNNEILFNGLSLTSSIFTPPSPLIHPDILPSHLENIKETSINYYSPSVKDIVEQLQLHCNCDVNQTAPQLPFHFAQATTGKNEQKNRFFYFSFDDDQNLLSSLSDLLTFDTTYSYSSSFYISKINNSTVSRLLGLPQDDTYATTYFSTLVIAQQAPLKRLMQEWQKNETLDKQDAYSYFYNNLLAQQACKSSYSTVNFALQQLIPKLKPAYAPGIRQAIDSLDNFSEIALQSSFVSDSLIHKALVIKTNTSHLDNGNKDGLLWELPFKHSIASPPQLLKNHRSKTLDLFIQDSENVIYLINSASRIKWSRKLDGKIIGKVKQIDIYNNGKWQMILNTENSLFVIDINGNNVGKFPVKLPAKATSEVAVFDYTGTHNYRFWVSCNNHTTYNFNNDAQGVKGWTKPRSESIIRTPFNRFVMNGKDYIYSFDDNGKCYFLNRRGEVIHTLKNPIKTNRKVYLQKRTSFETSSFIYTLDSNSMIRDYTFVDMATDFILDSTQKEAEITVTDIDNDNFVDFVSVFRNKIELYATDRSLITERSYVFDLKDNYTIIKDHKNNYFFIVKNENTVELLNAKLFPLHSELLQGSLLSTIGDFNNNGTLNFITVQGNTLKVYQIE